MKKLSRTNKILLSATALIAFALAFQNCGGMRANSFGSAKNENPDVPNPLGETDTTVPTPETPPIPVDPCKISRTGSDGPRIAQISSPVRMRVYQRANGRASVPVGVVAGGNASCLEVRVVDEREAVVVDWSKMTSKAVAVGERLLVNLSVPNGGWYKFEFRAVIDGVAGPTTGIDYVGVGEVFITAGQSNSTFFGETPQRSLTGKVTYFDGADWQLCQDPLAKVDPQNAGGAPWCPIGDNIANGYGVPVAFVPTGWGGSSIAQWQKSAADSPGGPGVLHERFLQIVKYFGPSGVRAVLWHQGESDVGNSQNTYVTALAALIQASREASASPTPWLVAKATFPNDWASSPLPLWRTLSCEGTCVAERDQQRAQIRAAQGQLVGAGAVFAGPDTDTLGLSYRYDGIHFNQAGLNAEVQLWSAKINDAVQSMGY